MTSWNGNRLSELIINAIGLRDKNFQDEHQCAFRLFNGFYEGFPELAADVYGRTLVLFSYCKDDDESSRLIQTSADEICRQLPWLDCVLGKFHHSLDPDLRRGVLFRGEAPADQIIEAGVHYAVNLTLNQDASFYLDTRELRSWLLDHARDCDVLNTFAYTGSLGVAALAGGARQVIQMDRNRRFLELANRSASLNAFGPGRMKLLPVDFFVGAGQFKRSGRLFDLIILDPPFFSITEKGMVDQARESHRLINKLRPLVKDGGILVAINNSLFLNGADYYSSLTDMCRDGYLEIQEILQVPEDFTGYPGSIVQAPPVDPAPFNHPTKIAVLRVKRKGIPSKP